MKYSCERNGQATQSMQGFTPCQRRHLTHSVLPIRGGNGQRVGRGSNLADVPGHGYRGLTMVKRGQTRGSQMRSGTHCLVHSRSGKGSRPCMLVQHRTPMHCVRQAGDRCAHAWPSMPHRAEGPLGYVEALPAVQRKYWWQRVAVLLYQYCFAPGHRSRSRQPCPCVTA